MFIFIESQNVELYRDLIVETFRLRKKVFADSLNWDVSVQGDEESDRYDWSGANYLVWCSEDQQRVYGSIRLISTDAPTLLHDVFWATHNRSNDLRNVDIWEGTRMCVDKELILRDFQNINCSQAVGMLLVALCEAALAFGIERLVSNFEPAMSRIYKKAGLKMNLHGRADGYGRRPVCCASFEVSQSVLAKMRRSVGVELPLLRPQAHLIPDFIGSTSRFTLN